MNNETQKALLATCGRYIRKQLAPMEKRIQELEDQLKEVEQKGQTERALRHVLSNRED